MQKFVAVNAVYENHRVNDCQQTTDQTASDRQTNMFVFDMCFARLFSQTGSDVGWNDRFRNARISIPQQPLNAQTTQRQQSMTHSYGRCLFIVLVCASTSRLLCVAGAVLNERFDVFVNNFGTSIFCGVVQ